jgi:glycosyltransferase involved in cell wall biosynthesis
MTVYNGERYLRPAIESIRGQSLPHFQFTIVDDGSTDSTPQILAEAAQADSRIQVISGGRIGRAKALNMAWQASDGEYIANLDADDTAVPERLESQLAYFRRWPHLGLVGTACRLSDAETGQEWIEQHPLQNEALRRLLVRHNPFVHSSVMIPRRVLTTVGGYNEQFKKCIDYELWVRIARHYPVANMPEVLTNKRVHPEAYFRHHVTVQERQKAHLKIRWQAWLAFSRSLPELRYVLREPVVWGFKNGILRYWDIR